MISFDNSFFYSESGLNLNQDQNFKKNLKLAKNKADELIEEFSTGQNEILKSFTSEYQKKIRDLKKTVDLRGKKKVVIGLGGSSSGAKALSFFMNDDIIYFDNLDFEFIKNFFLKNNIQDYFYFVISKSGDTFETLAILNLLVIESKKKKNYDIFKSMVILTENKESILKSYCNKKKIKFIEHNSKIGGRYSILSETGMIPFIDNDFKVEEGSEKFIKILNEDNHLSPTNNIAIIFTILNQMNLGIYCNLIYNYRLKHFSYWFHQLHAESLGKNKFGMTPVTSICPKDHHSMMQLYLDGPRDKFFNLFSPPDETFYEKFGNEGFFNIEKYTPRSLLEAQFKSVVEVFSEKKIPHRIIQLHDHKNPLNLIELFAYFLLETMLLGKMMGVNPYDQPAVQLIKKKIFEY
jgi:glucose-6-phosphate isomerase